MSFLETFKTFWQRIFLREEKKEEKLLSLEEARREKRIENLTNDIINKYCCCEELKKTAVSKNRFKTGS